MSEKHKFSFNNPNYSGIAKDLPKNEGKLYILDASDEIYKKIADAENRAEKAMQESTIDSLTGCYNRNFFDRFKTEAFDARRYDKKLGLAFFDLNGLKSTNDKYGHSAGDKLIIEAAEKLKENFRKTDFIIRLGGDEFVVICRNFDNDDHFEEKVVDQITKRLVEDAELDCAFGFAVYDKKEDQSLDDTLNRADARMYRCKKAMKELPDGVEIIKA